MNPFHDIRFLPSKNKFVVNRTIGPFTHRLSEEYDSLFEAMLARDQHRAKRQNTMQHEQQKETVAAQWTLTEFICTHRRERSL
jgi:hypothetical protein